MGSPVDAAVVPRESEHCSNLAPNSAPTQARRAYFVPACSGGGLRIHADGRATELAAIDQASTQWTLTLIFDMLRDRDRAP